MTDEKVIWDTLLESIQNEYGVAGLMGNLFAESSLNPQCKTGGDKSIKGWQYTEMVDNGAISKEIFCKDGAAYGLAQWCYHTRKEALYDRAKKENMSIGSLQLQLAYMMDEISNHYKTVWQTLQAAESIREASDIVLLRYEKPANTGETVRKKRADYAQGYLDRFGKDRKEDPEPAAKQVRTLADRVLVRSGNGKQYGSIGRIETRGSLYPWVATAENDWHAIEITIGNIKRVAWISGDYSEVT